MSPNQELVLLWLWVELLKFSIAFITGYVVHAAVAMGVCPEYRKFFMGLRSKEAK